LAIYIKISDQYAFVIYKGLERTGYLAFDEFKEMGTLTYKGKEFVFISISNTETTVKKYSYTDKKPEKRKYSKKITKIEY